VLDELATMNLTAKGYEREFWLKDYRLTGHRFCLTWRFEIDSGLAVYGWIITDQIQHGNLV